MDIANRVVAHARTEPLGHGELALKKLATAANRAGRVALNKIERGARSKFVAPTRADLLLEGFSDSATRDVWRRLRNIRKLCPRCQDRSHKPDNGKPKICYFRVFPMLAFHRYAHGESGGRT